MSTLDHEIGDSGSTIVEEMLIKYLLLFPQYTHDKLYSLVYDDIGTLHISSLRLIGCKVRKRRNFRKETLEQRFRVQNGKILVVDDNRNFLFGISRTLTNANFAMITEHDGYTGIERTKADQPAELHRFCSKNQAIFCVCDRVMERGQAGTQFDPSVVAYFLEHFSDVQSEVFDERYV